MIRECDVKTDQDKMAIAGQNCIICHAIKSDKTSELCSVCNEFLASYSSETSNIETLVFHYEKKVIAEQVKRFTLHCVKNLDYDFEIY
mgnify:CR=1 FL=1